MRGLLAAFGAHGADMKALRKAAETGRTSQTFAEAKRAIMEGVASRLTEWHVVLLRFSLAPTLPENYIQGSLRSALMEKIPELQECPGFADELWRDLHSLGLVGCMSLEARAERGGNNRATTAKGESFLNYLTS
jgi:hypothetical protein